jgi:hypothetical protein
MASCCPSTTSERPPAAGRAQQLPSPAPRAVLRRRAGPAPLLRRTYWLGLEAPPGSNSYGATDPLLAPRMAGGAGYLHWGNFLLEDGSESPAPATAGFQCAVANSSMAFGASMGLRTGPQVPPLAGRAPATPPRVAAPPPGAVVQGGRPLMRRSKARQGANPPPSPPASCLLQGWGYADEDCEAQHVMLCRLSRECGLPRAHVCHPSAPQCPFPPPRPPCCCCCISMRLAEAAARPLDWPCALPTRLPPPPRPAAHGAAPPYTAPSTGAVFYFNSTPQNTTQAEAACIRNGGHLVAYTAVEEQAEVRGPGAGGSQLAAGRAGGQAGSRRLGRVAAARSGTQYLRMKVPSPPPTAPPAPPLPCPIPRLAPLPRPAQVEAHFQAQGFMYPAFHTFYLLGLARASSGSWSWLDITLPSPRPSTYVNWGTNQPAGAGPCGGAGLADPASGVAGWADGACGRAAPFMCRVMGGQPKLCRPGPEAALDPGLALDWCSPHPVLVGSGKPRPLPSLDCRPGPVYLHQQQQRPGLRAQHHHRRPAHRSSSLQRAGRPPGQLAQPSGAARGGAVLHQPGPTVSGVPPVLLDRPGGHRQ